MYHSWWFITLLFIFAANIIICSLDRLPRILKLVKEPIKPLNPGQFNSFPINRQVSFKGKSDDARSAVESALKNIGFKSNVYQGDGALQIYAEKGRFSRLGVYVTRLSILLILIGAVVGIFFGFNASLNLLEGTSSSAAYKRGGGTIPLGFEIRCLDFDVYFYENSDSPKGYKSWLAILENGMPVKIKGKEVTEIDVKTAP